MRDAYPSCDSQSGLNQPGIFTSVIHSEPERERERRERERVKSAYVVAVMTSA